jgi:hypothetical protein
LANYQGDKPNESIPRIFHSVSSSEEDNQSGQFEYDSDDLSSPEPSGGKCPSIDDDFKSKSLRRSLTPVEGISLT